MNILDIVKKGLEATGHDGLYEAGICACENSNLSPGDCLSNNCKPGYKHIHSISKLWVIHPDKDFIGDEEIESIIEICR